MNFIIAKHPSAGGLMASVLDACGVENVGICIGAFPEQMPIGIESTMTEVRGLDESILVIGAEDDAIRQYPNTVEIRPQIWGINDNCGFNDLDLDGLKIKTDIISRGEVETLFRDGYSKNFTVTNIVVSMSGLTFRVAKHQQPNEQHVISLSWQNETRLTIRILNIKNDASVYSAKYILWYYLTEQNPTLRITRWTSNQMTMPLTEYQQAGETMQTKGYELLSDSVTLKTVFALTSELDEALRLGFLMPKW